MTSGTGAGDAREAVRPVTRFAGYCAVVSGLLYAGRAMLERAIGEPPTAGGDLVAWRDAHQAGLAWADELMVLSAALLLPVVPVLYRRLGGTRRPWVSFGCALLATMVPVVLVLAVFQGRLMYPVFDIGLGEEQTVALVVSLYYGGAHVVALMLAAALVMLGTAMRSEPWGRPIAVLAIIAALGQVVAGYPWIAGPNVVLAAQVLAAAWFVVVGVVLLQPDP